MYIHFFINNSCHEHKSIKQISVKHLPKKQTSPIIYCVYIFVIHCFSPPGVPVSLRRSVAVCCWAVTQQCSVLLMEFHSVWTGRVLSCMAPTASPNQTNTNSLGYVQIHPAMCCPEPTVPKSLLTWNLMKFTPIRHPVMPLPLCNSTTTVLLTTTICLAHPALSIRYLAHSIGTTTLWHPTVQIQRVAPHPPDHQNPAWTQRHAGEALSPLDRMETWLMCLSSQGGTLFQLWRTSSFTEVLDLGN